MSVKPILFNTEMVQAILDGRKTVTRRCVKPPGEIEDVFGHMNECKQPCQPGDILYVRESAKITGYGCMRKYYVDCEFCDGEKERFYVPFEEYRRIMNKCTMMFDSTDPYKKPKFSPYWLTKHESRIWLRVKEVQAERLQTITALQALSEGVSKYTGWETEEYKAAVEVAKVNGTRPPLGYNSIQRFAHLWDSTIKKQDTDKYGWNANPWVWVIEFERCEKPEEG